MRATGPGAREGDGGASFTVGYLFHLPDRATVGARNPKARKTLKCPGGAHSMESLAGQEEVEESLKGKGRLPYLFEGLRIDGCECFDPAGPAAVSRPGPVGACWRKREPSGGDGSGDTPMAAPLRLCLQLKSRQGTGLLMEGLRAEVVGTPAAVVMKWYSWVLSRIRVQGYQLPSYL